MYKKTSTMTAFSKACWLLSRREYSEKELRDSLLRKEFLPDDVNDAVVRLINDGWLNDERAAKSVMNTGLARRYGPKRLRLNALMKGIDEDIVDKTMEEQDVDWKELAYDTAQRKYGAPPYAPDIKVKVASLLMRKGYPSDVCWAVAGASKEWEGDDD